MKKLVFISLFIFWAAVVAVLVAGLVFYQNTNLAQPTFGQPTPRGSSLSTSGTNGQSITLDMQEISKHNSASDCWLLINSKVYDVTSFLSIHPGGSDSIIRHCGQESTQAFNTKDVGRPHSASATSMLSGYYIGNLNQTMGQNTSAGKTHPAATAPKTTPNKIVPVTPVVPPTGANGQSITLDMQEISKHNSASDCWLLINNKVYNVTSFIAVHPGGASAIVRHCGQESTQAFNTKDVGRPHSASAASMLNSYYIGDLNQTIGQTQIQQSVQQTNSVPPPAVGGEDSEND